MNDRELVSLAVRLLFGAVFAGAGIAVGVPWAVFHYAPMAGLGGLSSAILALTGITGGIGVALLAVFSTLPSEVGDDRESKAAEPIGRRSLRDRLADGIARLRQD